MVAEIYSSDFESFVPNNKADDNALSKGKNINTTVLNTPYGNILFKEQPLREDLFILEGHYNLDNDVAISGEGSNALLEIQFNMSEEGIVYQDKSGMEKIASAGAGNLVFLPPDENKAKIFFKKNIVYNSFDIHIPLSFLERFVGESELMDGFLEKIHNNIGAALSSHAIAVNPTIYNTIQDIQNCKYVGLTRKIYLEAKVYELIALMNEHNEKQITDYKLNAKDEACIQQAAFIIRNNLEQPCSIIDLARMVGVNQTKLKIGFKSVFGNTVFGYLQEIRMHQAKKHLLDTDMSVQEISLLLGYQNTSNFSNAFKKIHGYSPMKMRTNANE